MLPTAPRRGCLAPSGRGRGGAPGAGSRRRRRVGLGANPFSGLPLARRPFTPVSATWVARSAPPQSRGLGIVVASIFRAKTSAMGRKPLAEHRRAFLAIRPWRRSMLDGTCPSPESVHIRDATKANASQFCGASQIIQESLRDTTAGLSHKPQSDIGVSLQQCVASAK